MQTCMRLDMLGQAFEKVQADLSCLQADAVGRVSVIVVVSNRYPDDHEHAQTKSIWCIDDEQRLSGSCARITEEVNARAKAVQAHGRNTHDAPV